MPRYLYIVFAGALIAVATALYFNSSHTLSERLTGGDSEERQVYDEEFYGTAQATDNTALLKLLQKQLSQEARKRYRLKERVDALESQLAQLQLMVASQKENIPAPIEASEKENEMPKEEDEVTTWQDKESKLVDAGLAPDRARFILDYLGEIEMEKLYMQDRATREGWMGTSRYREEYLALREREMNIRQELGETDFDRYLFGSGQPNRVIIQSIIAGSPAQEAGLLVGDIVLRYAGKRILAVQELKQATTEGTAGDMVSVDILREGGTMEFYIPRGPLGVTLGTENLRP